ncbi:hypothetical protein D3C78_1973270 [compost metagenome]
MATEAVPIMAWCSLPIDRARTQTSISLAATVLPLEDTYSVAGATKAIFGVCWRAAASAMSAIRPIFSAP